MLKTGGQIVLPFLLRYEKGVFQRLRYSEFSFSFYFSHSTSQGCSSYSLRSLSSSAAIDSR